MSTKSFRGKSKLGAYGDIVMQLDDIVGQINTALKETGLDKNTLLIFTSDNGPGPPSVKAMAAHDHDSAGGLRGSNADSWEGGHRIPLIVQWPGQTPAGGETSATVNLTDIFATFTEMLETDLPTSAVDSHSFLPVLLDPDQSHKRPSMIHGRHGVRDVDWKAASATRRKPMESMKPSDFQLFNLEKDLAEQNDVSKQHPEKAKQLFQIFTDFVKGRQLK